MSEALLLTLIWFELRELNIARKPRDRATTILSWCLVFWLFAETLKVLGFFGLELARTVGS